MQDFGERFGGKFGIDADEREKIQNEMDEQLKRLKERHQTLVEQEKDIKESRKLIDEAKPKTETDGKGRDSVTCAEYSGKDGSDVEAEARAKQNEKP